jgi:choline dehydrogenase-like flavoprotein
MTAHYDVIVIGSGAGGGSLVHARALLVENRYVVDTSCFPSIGAVNPALTAMANGLRVGDHRLERLGAPQTRPEPAGVV